jgi:transglutaminase-like putative cysteine protease
MTQPVRVLPLLPLCALLLLSCSGVSTWLDDDELRKTLREPLPAAELHADAGAVVLLDEGFMEISSSGEIGISVFEHHRIVRILNPRGQRFANIVIPYGSTSVVDQIEARTVQPEGRIIPLKDTDVFDVSLHPNFVFFSDQRAKIFTMPAVEDGAVVEYRYRLTMSGRTFWHSWTFQEEAPVVLSRFTLMKPGDWDVIYRSYGTPITPSITPAPAGFRSRHVWEARNLPPLRSEFGMPPVSEVATHLAVAPVGFKTWEDIAHWYTEVVGKRTTGGAAVESLAGSLTNGLHTDADKLRRIFEWVRDQVRYLAVEIGVGGYEPHSADDVFAKRYGDCKDMVALLIAMARAVNVEVQPVLISTWHNGRADTTLPSALQFNHLIGFAPNVVPGGIWLDATDKAGVFGTLPWYDQGMPVVVTGPAEKGYRAITPAEPASANTSVLNWTAELNADGSALVSGKTTLTGAPALDLRNDLRVADSADVRQWLGTSLAHRCPGATLLHYDLPQPCPPQDTLTVAYTFRTLSFSVHRDSLLVIRPWAFNPMDAADYFREAQRAYPIRFRYPSQSEFRLTVHAPLGWQYQVATATDSAQMSWGRSVWQYTTQPDVARLQMHVTLQGEDLLPAHYPAFRDFLDNLRMREWREITLSRSK